MSWRSKRVRSRCAMPVLRRWRRSTLATALAADSTARRSLAVCWRRGSACQTSKPTPARQGDASGGVALRTAYLAVASGAVPSAMVIGVEKATDIVGSARISARNVSLDADFEAVNGATLTAMAAMLMRRYMHEYNVELAQFEGFSLNAHRNGSRKPTRHVSQSRCDRAPSFARQ